MVLKNEQNVKINFQMGVFYLHAVLFTTTTFLIMCVFLFYHHRRWWSLALVNLFNVVGICCLFLESMENNIHMAPWLFGSFALLHYGGLLGLIFFNVRFHHLYMCGHHRTNCMNMIETLENENWTWRNLLPNNEEVGPGYPVDISRPINLESKSISEAETVTTTSQIEFIGNKDVDKTPKKSYLRLLCERESSEDETLLRAKYWDTGSLLTPLRGTFEEELGFLDITRYIRYTTSAPELRYIHRRLGYSSCTVFCQAEVHDNPKPTIEVPERKLVSFSVDSIDNNSKQNQTPKYRARIDLFDSIEVCSDVSDESELFTFEGGDVGFGPTEQPKDNSVESPPS